MRWSAMKSTFLYFLLHVHFITCHLKDMGEVRKNWTHVLQHLEKRIIGGHSASKKSYPHAVQLFNFGALCGGTILTYKTVLTAAHCFDDNTNLAEIKIIANPRFLYDYQAMSHEVWDVVIHRKYNRPVLYANDIAIVIIHDEFKFGPWVKKGVLANTDAWMKENTEFTVTGWGETKYGEGLKSKDLKKTHLYYVNKKKCMMINKIKLGPEMFCLHGDRKRDTCRGDSGGGVLWKGFIVGIVSHGRGCAETPGMYVNVYFFRKWIHKTVYRLYEKFCKFHKKGKPYYG